MVELVVCVWVRHDDGNVYAVPSTPMPQEVADDYALEALGHDSTVDVTLRPADPDDY